MITRIAPLLVFFLALPAYAQNASGSVLTPQGNISSPTSSKFDNAPAVTRPVASSSAATADVDPGPATKYAKPTWANLMKTMARFNAFDLDDDGLLNEYAKIAECDIYKQFSGDDFMWHRVKEEMRTSLRMNKDNFPAFYHYDVKLQFAHYDFNKQIYFFTEKSKVKNVNTFGLLKAANATGACANDKSIFFLPHVVRAVIDDPVAIYGIPLPVKDAEALLDQMNADGNRDHIVYARFNLQITYIVPLDKHPMHGTSGKMIYEQGGVPSENVRFDAKLDSADFYEDAAKTRLIYAYFPDQAAADKSTIPPKLDMPAQ